MPVLVYFVNVDKAADHHCSEIFARLAFPVTDKHFLAESPTMVFHPPAISLALTNEDYTKDVAFDFVT